MKPRYRYKYYVRELLLFTTLCAVATAIGTEAWFSLRPYKVHSVTGEHLYVLDWTATFLFLFALVTMLFTAFLILFRKKEGDDRKPNPRQLDTDTDRIRQPGVDAVRRPSVNAVRSGEYGQPNYR